MVLFFLVLFFTIDFQLSINSTIKSPPHVLLIFISDKYYRPTEVDVLLGDSTKAMITLGWEPKTTFDELINMMVDHDTRCMYTII